jgi:hypothetical protein
MNRSLNCRVLMAGCIVCLGAGSLIAEDQNVERKNIELLQTLEIPGEYISLQGTSLFLTSHIKTKQAGYWLDIGKNPVEPVLVNENLPPAWDVAVVGKHAVVCDYTKILAIYEIKDHQWKPAATLAMPSMTENLIIRDHLAYVANHIAGLTIVDISNPAKPVLVSNINPGIDCDAIGLQKDCAVLYGHQESRIVFVDISDPAQPRQLGIYQHEDKSFNQGELVLDNGLAYCTAKNGLVIVDVADPTHPKLVKVVEMSTVHDVKVLNGYAFVSSLNGITVLDMRDPANPVEAGRYPCNARELWVEPVAADYCIYASGKDGLKVMRFRPSPGKPD